MFNQNLDIIAFHDDYCCRTLTTHLTGVFLNKKPHGFSGDLTIAVNSQIGSVTLQKGGR